MKFLHRAAVALAALVVSGVAAAAYPERPITLIVPWGAGGAPTPPRASSARCSRKS